MNLSSLLWCWLLRFVSSQQMFLSSERPITPASIEVTKTRMTDLAKRNAVMEEFKTLDEDIKTVKKLKIMVEVFDRIKKENPAAYDRMVRFFEENEKAHRIRRSFLQELRSLGRKTKVEALEQKLDSSVKCHPKSGKELIHMFVRGLSDLYPDMTKLLMKELEGAMDLKNVKKTTSKRATVKNVDKKISTASEDALTGKSQKGRCTTETTCSTETSCTTKCPEATTMCCTTSCSTSTSSCATTESETNCKHRCAQEESEEAGDMRIHPTAKLYKRPDPLISRKKSKLAKNENVTLTAPFKDFQVQGSIMFSNPSKPVKKSTLEKTAEQTRRNSTSVDDANVDKARIVENWRDWNPKSDSSNVISPEGNGLSNAIMQPDFIKSSDPQFQKMDNIVRVSRENSEEKLSKKLVKTPAAKSAQTLVSQFMNDPNPESSATMLPRRNKKRSMYVLYE